MATEELAIVVSERGTQEVTRRIKAMADAGDQASGSYNKANDTFNQFNNTFNRFNQTVENGNRTYNKWDSSVRNSVNSHNKVNQTVDHSINSHNKFNQVIDNATKNYNKYDNRVNNSVNTTNRFRSALDQSTNVVNRHSQAIHNGDKYYIRMSNSARRLQNEIDRTSKGMLTLTKIVAAYYLVHNAGRQIIAVADSYTLLQNRIRTVTKDQNQLMAVTEQLVGVADRTRTSLADTASVYSRTAASARVLGKSQKDVISFTESLQQAVQLSGAAPGETGPALIQFAQAMSSNRLSGDELRSILEQAPVIGDVIVDYLNKLGTFGFVTRSGLKELGKQGKLTSKIMFDAFVDQADEIQARFDRLVPTIGQSMVRLKNVLDITIGKFAEGPSRSFAALTDLIVKNTDTIINCMEAIGYAISIYVSARAVAAAGHIALLIATNPWLAFGVAVAGATSLLFAFSDKIIIASNGTVTLQDAFVAAGRIAERSWSSWIDDIIKKLGLLESKNKEMSWMERIGEEFAAGVEGRQAYTEVSTAATRYRRAFGEDFSQFVVPLNEAERSLNAPAGSMYGGTREDREMANESLKGIIKAIENKLEMVNAIPTRTVAMETEKIAAQNQLQALLTRANKAQGNFSLLERPDKVDLPVKEKKEKGYSWQDALDAMEDRHYQEWQQENILKSKEAELKVTKDLAGWDKMILDIHQKMKEAGKKDQIDEDLINSRRKLFEEQSRYNNALEQGKKIGEEVSKALDEQAKKQHALDLQKRVEEFDQQFLDLENSDNFGVQYRMALSGMVKDTENAAKKMAETFASIFGPGGTFVTGVADSFASAILHANNFGDVLQKTLTAVRDQILHQFISTGIQIGLNALVSSVTPGGAIAGGAFGGITRATPFATGGYTGNFGRSEVAGVVHGQEYVMSAAATERIGVQNLERMNNGAPSGSSPISVNVHDYGGNQIEIQQLSPGQIDIMIKQGIKDHAPTIIAGDINNPNGKTSKALAGNFNSGRRRT